jgi:hypothetical protein
MLADGFACYDSDGPVHEGWLGRKAARARLEAGTAHVSLTVSALPSVDSVPIFAQDAFLRTALGVFLCVLVMAICMGVTALRAQWISEQNAELTFNLRRAHQLAHADQIDSDMKLEGALADEIEDMIIVRDAKAQAGSLLSELYKGLDAVALADPKRRKIKASLDLFKAKLNAIMESLYQHMKTERSATEEDISKLTAERDAESATAVRDDLVLQRVEQSRQGSWDEAPVAHSSEDSAKVQQSLMAFFHKLDLVFGIPGIESITPEQFLKMHAFWEQQVVPALEGTDLVTVAKRRDELSIKMAQMLIGAGIVCSEDGRWIGECFENVLQGAALRAQKNDLMAIKRKWLEGNLDFEVMADRPTGLVDVSIAEWHLYPFNNGRLSTQAMHDLQERAKLYGLPLHWMFSRQATDQVGMCPAAQSDPIV